MSKAAQTPIGPPPSQDAWASQAGAGGMALAESETDGECSSYYRVTWEPRLSQQTEVGQLCYDPVNQSLTMVNKDIALHRRCLLLGYTNKKEDQRASIIGQFGTHLMFVLLCTVCVVLWCA